MESRDGRGILARLDAAGQDRSGLVERILRYENVDSPYNETLVAGAIHTSVETADEIRDRLRIESNAEQVHLEAGIVGREFGPTRLRHAISEQGQDPYTIKTFVRKRRCLFDSRDSC
jgi:hypothetical protein